MQNRLLSKEIQTFLKLILAFFIFSLLFRLIFYFIFRGQAGTDYSTNDLFKAFYIGAKFDLRAAIFLSLPFWFLGYVFKFVNFAFEDRERKMFFDEKPHPTKALTIFYTLFFLAYTIFFIVDIGHYDYLKARVDASASIFLKNPLISLQMINESYPVALVLFGLILFAFLIFFVLKILIFNQPIFVKGERLFQTSFKYKAALFFILAALGHAKLSQYPLRWSEALFSQNSLITAMGLNPLLYFYDTLAFSEKKFDEAKVREAYPIVSEYLKVKNPNKSLLNFTRDIVPTEGAFNDEPNVVVIMMESLAAFKLSYFGQKMNGSPFLDSLIPQSLFFENAYVTSTGTARSIFSTLTGLPDIKSVDTASRDPLITKQYSAANAFDNYNKSYFIGGSANWGNIRGFVGQSIDNIKIYEEKDFQSSKNDVWGISDLKLFREANKFLKEKTPEQKQFLFIQTAGYHRPYTIPTDRGDFELEELSTEEIETNGFVSNEEFNSLRFSDYALGEFFRLAKKEPYFQNTLFIIYADHGLSHFYSKDVGPGEKHFKLPVMHIPLIFYSPGLRIEPQVYTKVAYNLDILPSAVSLAGKTYPNKTLGRNLFDPKYDDRRFALTVSSFSPPQQLRILDEKWITPGSSLKLEGLYPYKDLVNYSKDFSKDFPEEVIYRNKLARGLYETTKYLYYNSRKK